MKDKEAAWEPGTRSLREAPASAALGTPGKARPGGASTPGNLGPSPTRWGASSPGASRAATAAGPSLSGDRGAKGPSASWPGAPASARAVTSSWGHGASMRSGARAPLPGVHSSSPGLPRAAPSGRPDQSARGAAASATPSPGFRAPAGLSRRQRLGLTEGPWAPPRLGPRLPAEEAEAFV